MQSLSLLTQQKPGVRTQRLSTDDQDVGSCSRRKVSSLLGERPSPPGHVSYGHGIPTDYVVVPSMIMCRGGVALSPSAGSQLGICEHATVRWAGGTGRLGLRCECPAHLRSAQTPRPIPPPCSAVLISVVFLFLMLFLTFCCCCLSLSGKTEK